MTQFFKPLSAAAQTAFANLDTAVRNSEFDRSVADLAGNFASKLVNGRIYWYYQAQTPDGVPMQIYLGPQSERLQRLMERKKREPSGQISMLVRSCQALGCYTPAQTHGRVIKKLADFGFFRAGGILAGTHAFLAYQQHLGVLWIDGNTTMDVDFTHAGKNIAIALPATLRVDTHKAVESLEMGFFPVANHAKYIKAGEHDFVLDFLTVVGKSGMEPIFSKQLNTQLQPLKFMELSVEDPLQTAFLTSSGATLVNLPQPERFALHKLIVQGERKNQPAKSAKDVVQACTLIAWLLINNPGVLLERIEETLSRGPGWRKRLTQGFLAVQRKFPQLYEELEAAGLSLEESPQARPRPRLV